MKTAQYRPCDAVIEQHKRNNRDQNNFETMAIHVLIQTGAEIMPPAFHRSIARLTDFFLFFANPRA
jgi:hypothetical protein